VRKSGCERKEKREGGKFLGRRKFRNGKKKETKELTPAASFPLL